MIIRSIMLKLAVSPPFNRFSLASIEPVRDKWLQDIIDAFGGIFTALYDGILSVINGILHMVGAPFEGISKVVTGWFEGVTGAIRTAFGQSPLFIGILCVIVIGGIILYIYNQYQGVWHALQSPAATLTGLGGGLESAARVMHSGTGGSSGGGGGGEKAHTAKTSSPKEASKAASSAPASRVLGAKPKASKAKSTVRKSKKATMGTV
jgi:hypothetical protein